MFTQLRKTKTAALLLLLLFASSSAMAGRCDNQDIVDFGAGLSGSATMCVLPDGLRAQFRVKGLIPGDAYTIWWVYFDDPSMCHNPGECGADEDFGGDDPAAVFGRYGSLVANRNGNANLGDSLNGMMPSSGSQLILLMLSHGQANYADAKHMARQLLTPEDPAAGAPHLGNIIDGAGFVPVGATFHVID